MIEYEWEAEVDYGDGGTSYEELASGICETLESCLGSAYERVASDIADTIREAQAEIRRVVAGYRPPPTDPYPTLLDEALNRHEAPYGFHYVGIEYLRMSAQEVAADWVVENDQGDWWTSDKVRELAHIVGDTSTHTVREIVVHDDWPYRVRVAPLG